MDKEAIEIGRFISGDMDAQERLGFEATMNSDPFLKEAVAGFRKDLGALGDLPTLNAVKIQWWWSLVGVVAVAVVFLLIPQKVIDVPVFAIPMKNEAVENLRVPVEESVAIIQENNFNEKKTLKPIEIYQPELEEETLEFKAKTVYPKPAALVEKSELPKLQLDENILFILDLKVVDNSPLEVEAPLYELSDLTDFTPANFSTSVAYKRAEKYRGIFSEPVAPTYLKQLETGLKYFKSGSYPKAIRVFASLLTDDKQDVNALFYSALCEYELRNYEAASSGFAKVEGMANQVFNQESKWYRALSLWEMGRKDEARRLMIEISEGDGHYAERARGF